MKICRQKVKIAIKAHARGLTIREIAVNSLNVTERTLYNWIAQGRQVFIRVNAVETRMDQLSDLELLKLELFEGMKVETNAESTVVLNERLENRIRELAFEKKEKAEARVRRRTARIQSWEKNRKELLEIVAAMKELRRSQRELDKIFNNANRHLRRLKSC